MENSHSVAVNDVLLDRYLINGWQSGAMGRVYFCLDKATNLPVAVKTLDLDILNVYGIRGEILANQLEREAHAWITLEAHTNIVQAKSVKRRESQLYIIMEYVPGREASGGRQRELNSWIRRWFALLGQEGIGPQLEQILDFSIQICSGMEHAAQIFLKKKKEFVHQDIKPDNILVTDDGIVKITDFGLIKALQEKSEAFLVGAGTPEFMAPEQWSYKGETGIQTDVYAFGCVLYKMITGDPPFPCDRLGNRQCAKCDRCKEHHLYSIPERVYSQVANIPDKLDSIIMKCLDKRLGESGRYKNFSKIRQDLIELYKDYVGKAYRPPPSVIPAATQHMMWGVSLCQVGGRKEAIAHYIKAMEMDPDIASEFIPPNVADVFDIHCPLSTARNINGNLIFLIDNLHANYSQQKKLNGTLDILVGKYGFELISLEGGKDKIDLSFYRELEMTEQEKTRHSDFFLKNGRINGAEFFAITTNRDILLYGADTDKHGLQTEACKHALEERDEFLHYCQFALDALNLLCDAIYNNSLKMFLAEKSALKNHPYYLIHLNNYRSRLYIKNSFPNFDRAYEYHTSSQSNYDVEAANRERETLIDLLLEKLPDERRYSFAYAIHNFNKGSISEYRLFQYMTRAIGEYSNLDVHNLFPNFIKQMNRLIFNEGIDYFALFEYEIPMLEDKISERLCSTEARRKVDHFKKYIKQLQRWYSLRLPPYEAETILKGGALSSGKDLVEFLKNEAKMRGISVTSATGERDYSQKKTIFLPDRIEQLSVRAGPQMDFYSIGMVRSSDLIKNCLRQTELEGEYGAILVAGGFHLHFLIPRYLKEHNIPYVLITPKVEKLDEDDSRYFRTIFNNSDDNNNLFSLIAQFAFPFD